MPSRLHWKIRGHAHGDARSHDGASDSALFRNFVFGSCLSDAQGPTLLHISPTLGGSVEQGEVDVFTRFPCFFSVLDTDRSRQRKSLSFKERVRVRMGFICATGDRWDPILTLPSP